MAAKSTKKGGSQIIDLTPFLTPIAIMLAACMISTTIFFSVRDLPSLKEDSDEVLGVEAGTAAEFTSCLEEGRYEQPIKDSLAYGQSLGVSGTPGFFIGENLGDGKMKGFLVPGAYPYDAFKTVFDDVDSSGLDAAAKKFADEYNEGEEVEIKEVNYSDYNTKGESGAKIAVVEFTDYECPFCSRHVFETLPDIEDNYINNGKVVYAVADFPLSFHDDAQKAAEATACAAEQGKYWEMHDLLFDNQDALAEDDLIEHAVEVGLN